MFFSDIVICIKAASVCIDKQVYISRDVVFDENVFPFRQASKNFSSSTPPIFKCSLLPSLPIVSSIPASDLSQPHTDKNLATAETLQCTNEYVSAAYLHDASTSCAEPLGKATLSQQPAETHELHDGVDAASEPLSPSIEALIPAIPSPEQIPSVTRHRMLTSFQDITLRPKEWHDGTVPYKFNRRAFMGKIEPHDHVQAMQDKEWKQAMDSEFQALKKNKTWHLVPW